MGRPITELVHLALSARVNSGNEEDSIAESLDWVLILWLQLHSRGSIVTGLVYESEGNDLVDDAVGHSLVKYLKGC